MMSLPFFMALLGFSAFTVSGLEWNFQVENPTSDWTTDEMLKLTNVQNRIVSDPSSDCTIRKIGERFARMAYVRLINCSTKEAFKYEFRVNLPKEEQREQLNSIMGEQSEEVQQKIKDFYDKLKGVSEMPEYEQPADL